MHSENSMDIVVSVFALISIVFSVSSCEDRSCYHRSKYKNTLQHDINSTVVCEGKDGQI